MIKKLLPFVLALIGLGVGIGAGLALRPHDDTTTEAPSEVTEPKEPPEYVKLNNQFVVPVIFEGRVSSMVILSLSLEVQTGTTTQVYDREPKLRDVFLQVLFDHANAGGFRGSFTDGSNLILLRKALHEAAIGVLGDIVTDVLIVEIVRQDS
jgi:flagellar protein FliL